MLLKLVRQSPNKKYEQPFTSHRRLAQMWGTYSISPPPPPPHLSQALTVLLLIIFPNKIFCSVKFSKPGNIIGSNISKYSNIYNVVHTCDFGHFHGCVVLYSKFCHFHGCVMCESDVAQLQKKHCHLRFGFCLCYFGKDVRVHCELYQRIISSILQVELHTAICGAEFSECIKIEKY